MLVGAEHHQLGHGDRVVYRSLYSSNSLVIGITVAWEIVYFKLYKSQLPVVEKALETAGLKCNPGSNLFRKSPSWSEMAGGARSAVPWRA